MADQFTSLELVIPFLNTLDECDIAPVRYYRVFGKCSIHGVISSTWDEQPDDNARLVCGQCFDMIRRCPVYAFTEVARPENI